MKRSTLLVIATTFLFGVVALCNASSGRSIVASNAVAEQAASDKKLDELGKQQDEQDAQKSKEPVRSSVAAETASGGMVPFSAAASNALGTSLFVGAGAASETAAVMHFAHRPNAVPSATAIAPATIPATL